MQHINLRWLAIPFCTLFAALLIHSGALIRYTDTSIQKVPASISGPRTELADNYFYFTLLRHAPERFSNSPIDSLDSDGGDHRLINSISTSYAPALYFGYFIYRISAFITANPREALLLTAIFHTWILAVSITVLLSTFLNKKKIYGPILIFLLATFSMIGVDAFSLSAYYGFPYWNKSLLLNEPNSIRLINPTLFWSAGLLAATYVIRWLRDRRNVDILVGAVITFVCCLFSISVGAALVGAIGLTTAINYYKSRNMPWGLLMVFMAGFIGLAWTYLQLLDYAGSPLGQVLKHGVFISWSFKWQFLIFIIFVPFIKRYLKEESVFVVSLLIVSIVIGSICDSFNLGARLWLRGGAIFVWIIALFSLICLLDVIEKYINAIVKYFFKLIITIGIVAYVINAQYRGPESWVGFIQKEKAELYDWMYKNIASNSIVASRDIEDAFLIPIYTSSKSLFSSFGITQRTLDQEMRRFFYAMKIYGIDQSMAEEINKIGENDLLNYYDHIFKNASPGRFLGEKEDAVIFWRNVIYAPYVDQFSKVLAGESRHAEFVALINKRMLEGGSEKFEFQYAILNSEAPRPVYFYGWVIVYANRKYELLIRPD